MSPAKNKSNGRPPVDRSKVARVIFKIAESMGLSDRQRVEKLTNQVIERLEQSQTEYLPTLPGMENLVGKRARHQQRLPTEAEIEAMVMEILNAEINGLINRQGKVGGNHGCLKSRAHKWI